MKDFPVRLELAATAALVAFALSTSTKAQEAAGHAASSGQPYSITQQQPPRGQHAKASFRDSQTQDALAFAGRLVKEKGRILLKDAVTKMSYQLDDQSRVRPYIGKQVRVVGRLDLDSNMIHIDRIEPMS